LSASKSTFTRRRRVIDAGSGARSRLDPISRTARDELKVFQAHDIRREDFDTPQKGGLNRRA
jgi:hypothetical protein